MKRTSSRQRSLNGRRNKTSKSLLPSTVRKINILPLALVLLLVGSGLGIGVWQNSKAATVGLFAGHVPGRVLLGMAASESLRPTYDEALQITGPVYERRIFKPGWFTATSMNSMLNECDQNNQYCVISFKAPNNDWAGMASGKYDADLNAIMNVARSRTKPFAFGVHHEPQGDGDAATWAAMQEHLVTYLSPVNDKMAFTTIANGFWWGPFNGRDDAYIATYYPQSLIDKMNQYRGIMAADFYDAIPRADGTYATNTDRTSLKLQGFTDWARRKGVKAVGAGEFGTTSGPELTKSWKVMHDNRDIWGYANYFNSLANSKVDWRLIPDSYPLLYPDNVNDFGGTPTTEARLNAFKAAVIESAGGTAPPMNQFPDLVVTSVVANPAAPQTGQGVTFTAVVKNQGTAATAAGIHNVLFSVNGPKATWSNTHTSSLAAGASVTLTANGGTPDNPNGVWTPIAAGAYTIEAWTDERLSIPESNEDNNKLTMTVNVSDVTVAKSGDVNGDSSVNGLDLSTILSNYGKIGQTRAQGDLSGDGTVNGLDLSQVLANYGK